MNDVYISRNDFHMYAFDADTLLHTQWKFAIGKLQ